MINFKKLMETVYEPKAGDEKNFKDKHVIAKHETPFDSESQFTSNAKKAKRPADHDTGEDEAVYEAANVHTKRADKEPVIVRDVDPKTGQSKAKVVMRRTGEIKIGEEVEQIDELSDDKLRDYHAKSGSDRLKAKADVEKGMSAKKFTPASVQKTADAYKRFIKRGKGMTAAANKMSEETELEEKVKNAYAIGMASAMKSTGDTPPLKKSTINKGHEIARSIKKEALDPVGKADADIDNDGDTDKSDKYLHNRRKVIGKALRKEDLDEAVEVRHDRYMRSHGKKARDSGHGAGSWMFTHKSMGDVDYNNDKEVHTARGKFADAKKSAQKWAKEHGHHSVYVMESVDQLDELSPDTLHSYIKKATPDVVARTMSAVASNQSAQTKKHASKLGKRISGITGASGRLADKANSYKYEEVDQIDEVSTEKLRDYASAALQDKNKAKADKRWKYAGKAMDTVADREVKAAHMLKYNKTEEVDTGNNTAEVDNTTFKAYVKSNKPNKLKDVTEADAKTNSEASHKKYVKSNVKAPHQSFKEHTQLDELSKKTLGSYIKGASDRVASNSAEYRSVHSGEDSNRGTFADRLKHKKELSRDTNKRKAGMNTALDKLTKEEVEQIDELSRKTLSSYVKKAAGVAHRNTLPNAMRDRMTAANIGDKEWYKQSGRNADNRSKGIQRAADRLAKEDLDEAFKVGAMKLHDGSSVTLTRESVDSLNGLFHQLNSANKSKMEERMMSGKKGFQEILSFAENV